MNNDNKALERMSSIRDSARELVSRSLVESGLALNMQASYIEKVCEAASESKNPALQQNIKLPKNYSQEIAVEVCLQYLAERNMKLCTSAIKNESQQQFVRKHDDDWIQEQVSTKSNTNTLHEILQSWIESGNEFSLKLPPEEPSVHTTGEGRGSVKAREISVSRTQEDTKDTTIDNKTIATNDESRRPWNIPARQPIRGRKQHKYARQPAILSGNGHNTITVATGTVTTGTITPTGEDSFSTVSEQPPVIEKIIRKVKKSRPVIIKEEESVQVTLDSDRPKTTDPSDKPSYTVTYNTAGPTTTVSQAQNPQKTYTYTFETVSVDKPSETLDTKTETIKSTDSFAHEMAKPVNRGSSRHSTRDGNDSAYSSRRSQKTGNESHHSSRHSTREGNESVHSSRHSTREGDESRHSSRHSTREGSQFSSRRSSKQPEQINDNDSIESLNKSRKSSLSSKNDQRFSSKHSTRDGNEYSSRASSRKQAPAPPLSQPTTSSTTNQYVSSQETNRERSPLEAILIEQEKNGIIITPTQPSSTTAAANSNTANSQTQSKKTIGSYSDGPELDSSTLGDVSSDAGGFKTDSINNEKLGSDKDLWANQ